MRCRLILLISKHRMVWGTFFGDEVPQSARLSAGGGAKAIRAMPNASAMYLRRAS